MAALPITLAERSRRDTVDWNKLGFGRYFADHIYISDFKNGQWSDDRIIPYEAMPMYPGLMTLHYAQTIFEGLKAYSDFNGGINLFRADKNAERMVNSAERLVMPPFPAERFVEACHEIVKVDREWLPQKQGESLYLRPLMYGSDNFLGVHSSQEFRFIIMASPVGAYYEAGLKPIKIMVSDEYVRTVRGGLGMAKTASNYAASLYGIKIAKSKGLDQVLWLDGVHKEYVDEVGAMNIMFVIDDTIVTPSLENGNILPGVTRDTIIHLAPELGYKIEERPISITEVLEAHADGKLTEVFGVGTAAVISPVGLLHYKDTDYQVNGQAIGPVAQALYTAIIDIQHGTVPDTKGWIRKVL